MEQPWSVVTGSAQARLGSNLLGMGRAQKAALLLPLLAALPALQREAAQAWDDLGKEMLTYPNTMAGTLDNVNWTSPAAALFEKNATSHADGLADKAVSPQAMADTLRATATVFEALGYTVLVFGSTVLSFAILNKVPQINPFTRGIAEVAATNFGIQADRQAGMTAARTRAFLTTTNALLTKILNRLGPKKLILIGGAAGVMGGLTATSAMADDLRAHQIQDDDAAALPSQEP
ncbi:hypothetical protein [Nonomuraea recticatena]|uniref:Uncharacterized protein n=1 Tax=Nonomuraea recticatena TaxID=46178 RepID=A0ABP6FNX6_9ACTN